MQLSKVIEQADTTEFTQGEDERVMFFRVIELFDKDVAENIRQGKRYFNDEGTKFLSLKEIQFELIQQYKEKEHE